VGSYRDPRLVCLRNEARRGIANALNLGLARARGRLIARQDADDVSFPTRLEEQARVMWAHPALVICGSAYHVIDAAGATLKTLCPPLGDGAIRWKMLLHNAFCHTSVMVRAEALRVRGLAYSPSFEYAEDFHLWSALLEHGQGQNLDRPLVARRLHPRQVSRVFAERQEAAADRVALASLTRLGLAISLADVSALRQRYRRWPSRLTRDDVRLCRLLLRALSLFERRYGERALARSVRRRYLRHLLHPRSPRRLGLRARVSLLPAVLRDSVSSLLAGPRREAEALSR
jgi:glycosyltransferase involved in cell wall biosynthesis